MARGLRRARHTTPELDVTAFLNLMIVLVPVLLLGMVFSQINVLQINLPPASSGASPDDDKKKVLELVVRKRGMILYYPSGSPLKQFNKKQGKYDFKGLSKYLQRLKTTFNKRAWIKKIS